MKYCSYNDSKNLYQKGLDQILWSKDINAVAKRYEWDQVIGDQIIAHVLTSSRSYDKNEKRKAPGPDAVFQQFLKSWET